MAGIILMTDKGKTAGACIYIAAGIYLLITKTHDPITITAFAGILAAAALAVTRYTHWAAIGGAFLISVSVFLQTVLSYRCFSCMIADFGLLLGVLVLSLTEKSRYKKMLSIMACLMAVFLTADMGMHLLKNPLALQDNNSQFQMTRYLTAAGPDGGQNILDTAEKPVLLFSASCKACEKALETLIAQDPAGETWTPVQTPGDLAGGVRLLKDKGYRGPVYSTEWDGAVPVLVATRGDDTIKTHNPAKMLAIVERK